MKLKTKTDEQLRNEITSWHKWFAWHPVAYDGGFAWLEMVERRFNTETKYLSNGTWYYRPIESNK